jgi:hypothetical protein
VRLLAAGSNTRTDAYGVVSEYLMRERLAKLGYTAADLKELDSDKAQHFLTISAELDKIKRETEEREMKKAKRGK